LKRNVARRICGLTIYKRPTPAGEEEEGAPPELIEVSALEIPCAAPWAFICIQQPQIKPKLYYNLIWFYFGLVKAFRCACKNVNGFAKTSEKMILEFKIQILAKNIYGTFP